MSERYTDATIDAAAAARADAAAAAGADAAAAAGFAATSLDAPNADTGLTARETAVILHIGWREGRLGWGVYPLPEQLRRLVGADSCTDEALGRLQKMGLTAMDSDSGRYVLTPAGQTVYGLAVQVQRLTVALDAAIGGES